MTPKPGNIFGAHVWTDGQQDAPRCGGRQHFVSSADSRSYSLAEASEIGHRLVVGRRRRNCNFSGQSRGSTVVTVASTPSFFTWTSLISSQLAGARVPSSTPATI